MEQQQWIYARRPEGEVDVSSYELREGPIPEPNEGELLLKALYVSVDPYHRIQQAKGKTWEDPHPLGVVQGAGAVLEVVKGVGDIKAGDIVSAYSGWQRYATVTPDKVSRVDPSFPLPYYLGVLGMPGRTAYFGLLEAGRPKEGDVCVVSGAAGAVGSIVVQIAKAKGCYVIAVAGSASKVEYLAKLGADATINYKDENTTERMRAAIAKASPTGQVDVYFDNVGGFITDAVLELIALRARVVICGQISQYSHHLDEPETGPRFLHRLIYTRATIQGILARDYTDRNPEMLAQMGAWLRDGKVSYEVTVVKGFENIPNALNSLFHGANTGKLVVKV